MPRIVHHILLLLLLATSACKRNDPWVPIAPEPVDTTVSSAFDRFGVDNHRILKNGRPFQVKGVVYVPGYPGYLPWEIESSTFLPSSLKERIAVDLQDIKAMGANTVRFWGAPRYCYEALQEIDDLYFIQTIWIDGEAADFQDPVFKQNTKDYIQEVIDRVYSVFTDGHPPMVAMLIGNELSEASIRATDAAHPEITSYQGAYIVTDEGISASEAFIAEMADFARSYEEETYGNRTLLSYSNDIRTTFLLDADFLDFMSQNAYSYAVRYYRPATPKGSSSGTRFQGWVEQVKELHPNKPLLLTETGLSVSPNAPHVGPPDFGYGGNTPAEQAEGLRQNLLDLTTAELPMAGACIHEYLDAWWKFGLEDSYSQDPNDIEEWFGIAALKDTGSSYETVFRPAYHSLKALWLNDGESPF